MSFNVFTSTSAKYGTGFHVWHRVDSRIVGGGVLPSIPPVGTVIPAGTPVRVEESGGAATLIEFYEAAAAAAAADTTIKILAGKGLPKPEVGDFIMKAPATLNGNGTSAEVTEVTLNADGTYSLEISDALGAVAEGAVLVKAKAKGSGQGYPAIPNGLTWNDVYIKEGTHAATVAVVTEGVIYSDRIAPIPDIVKEKLSNIFFQKGV